MQVRPLRRTPAVALPANRHYEGPPLPLIEDGPMDLKRLSTGERYMALGGVLLVLDLLLLPWHRISIGIGAFGVTASRSGLESPNAFLGILAALIALAVVARIVVTEFTSVELPALPVTWYQADLMAGGGRPPRGGVSTPAATNHP